MSDEQFERLMRSMGVLCVASGLIVGMLFTLVVRGS